MAEIWSEENRLTAWLKVEQAVAVASARHGIIPQSAADAIARCSPPDRARVKELDAVLHHDVLAFLDAIRETLGDDARWLHFGITSYDAVDTANSLLLREAGEHILEGIEKVAETILVRAREHRDTLTIGRTHGMHAEITTFGLKLLGHRGEFLRAHDRLRTAVSEISRCAISGAVGTFPHLPPEVESDVAEILGLSVEPVSTQVIPRDRHASFIFALALTASAVERLAVEIRHLQRNEIGEVAEPFTDKQKGSSAMPHKRNPVLSENLTGLARLIRAQVAPALENIVLWHERDISHSSVERAIFPDCCALADFALARLERMISGLEVYPEKMEKNIALSGRRVYSQSFQLELKRAGMTCEDAYRLVQRHAFTIDNGREFLASLVADDEVRDNANISMEAFERLTDTDEIRRHLYALFDDRLARQVSSDDHAPRETGTTETTDVKVSSVVEEEEETNPSWETSNLPRLHPPTPSRASVSYAQRQPQISPAKPRGSTDIAASSKR
ncbi:MAG: adenylosuccinate lyase [Alphaproteobacteria bacterium]|nr:adenylosuccinate lyase [Alphaproteobacteria bacterium]MDA8003663.1 adenylosuccinate lyase [Alphaproteobacteria bacterium]MDA8005424.1 adenylosuccinate lyase [Alphaproteobacteria bacterium]MDA8012553.1 adenylosuccinate lyase [Alphaproteobacteria bacterium]